MDAVTTTTAVNSLTGPLDILVAVALIFLAVALLAVSIPLMSMVKQSERTLSSLDKLLGTVDRELGPTLKQVDTLLGSVVQLKSAAEKGYADVGSKVGDVKGGITKAADDAKHQTSVLGAGFMAGFKAYLEGHSHHNDKSDRRSERKALSEIAK